MEQTNAYPNIKKFDRYYKRVAALFKDNAEINDVYIFNIKVVSQNNLIFEVYSEEKPTSLYYKLNLSIDQLKKLSGLFQSKTNINEIYDLINYIISQNSYEIKFENSSNKTIVIILYADKEQIKIILPKEKIIFESNYYELYELYKGCLIENEKLVNYINNKEIEFEKLRKENEENKKKIQELEKQIIKINKKKIE